MLACGEREGIMMALRPTHDSAVLPWFCGCLAFFYHPFFTSPQSISPQSTGVLALGFCSIVPKLQLPKLQLVQGTSIPVLGMYGCGRGCLILIPFRPPQNSCFTLSLKCFSSDSDNCPAVGIRPLLQFPHPLRAGPILLKLLCFPLVPLSTQNLCGSMYSFPLVRYSCPFSADVLHALLCLKVYSWCVRGGRCTPCPPAPPPSCPPGVKWVLDQQSHSWTSPCHLAWDTQGLAGADPGRSLLVSSLLATAPSSHLSASIFIGIFPSLKSPEF